METLWENSQSSSSILGGTISVGNEKECIVTTDNEVVVVSLQTKECLMKWMYRKDSNLGFKHPVVKDDRVGCYYGISGPQQNVLMAWNDRTKDLKEAQMKRFPQDRIHQIHICPSSVSRKGSDKSSMIVVVFTNGSFGLYNDQLEAGISSSSSSECFKTLVWTHVVKIHQSTYVYLLGKQSNDEYALRVFLLSQDPAVPHRQVLNASIASTTESESKSTESISSCHLHSTLDQLSIFWSTNEWQVLKFKSTKSFDWTIDLASRQPTLSSVMQPKKRKRSNMTLNTETDAGKLMWLYQPETQELQGWNMPYQLALTSVRPLGEKKTPEVGQILSVMQDKTTACLYFISHQCITQLLVHSIPFKLVELLDLDCRRVSTLATKSATQVPSVIVDLKGKLDDFDNTQSGAIVDAQVWEDLVFKSSHTSEATCLAELEKASDPLAFEIKFVHYVSNSGPKTKSLKEKTRRLSYHFMNTVATQLIENPEKLHGWVPLRMLVQTGRLSARAIPNLLSTLMKYRQYQLLEDCVRHVQDIPERLIVRLTCFILNKAETHDAELIAFTKTKMNMKRHQAEGKKQLSGMERFLCLMVAHPVNHVFLHHAMPREMSLGQALAMLTFLHKVYVHYGQDFHIVQKQFGIKMPSLDQLLEWMGLILDIFYNDFVLHSAGDAQIMKILSGLATLVEEHISTCSHMAQVQGEIGHILAGVALPTAPIPDYSVDMLELF